MKITTIIAAGCIFASSYFSLSQAQSTKTLQENPIRKVAKNILETGKKGPDSNKLQEARKKIITMMKKEIASDKDIPEALIHLAKRMESDNDYAMKLLGLIGRKNVMQANSLLTHATKSKLKVVFVEEEDIILQFKLCAKINGVRRCFPSQRNAYPCPKW